MLIVRPEGVGDLLASTRRVLETLRKMLNEVGSTFLAMVKESTRDNVLIVVESH